MNGGGQSNRRKTSSTWWQDILALDNVAPENFFAQNCRVRVANGYEASFWHAWWMNEGILKDLYPTLFSFSVLQDVSVASMGGWSNNGWRWSDLGIPQRVIDEQLLALPLSSLLTSLPCLSPLGTVAVPLDSSAQMASPHGCVQNSSVMEQVNVKDAVTWLLDSSGAFSVSSCYLAVSAKHIPMGPVEKHDKAFKIIWKMFVPMKVKAFAWRSFFNRIPTRVALEVHGLNTTTTCCFCGDSDESIEHLFLNCVVATMVWKDMADWIGWKAEKFSTMKESFMRWYGYCKYKKMRHRREGVLWMATCWNIWLVRNGIVFRNDTWNINDIVWNTKILAWKWLVIGKISFTNCNFYNFCKDPLLFMS
ncbi:uncharacterized protein LOC131648585 [Vicia villosa]|uniref:uncharacterized protein LOC131648585 n=1 Tax=Vicia villosa TaxID=3911 RepID=UPI00273BCEBC|nr:uncharacterized protein LOC131648585 [Vicia villosa]